MNRSGAPQGCCRNGRTGIKRRSWVDLVESRVYHELLMLQCIQYSK